MFFKLHLSLPYVLQASPLIALCSSSLTSPCLMFFKPHLSLPYVLQASPLLDLCSSSLISPCLMFFKPRLSLVYILHPSLALSYLKIEIPRLVLVLQVKLKYWLSSTDSALFASLSSTVVIYRCQFLINSPVFFQICFTLNISSVTCSCTHSLRCQCHYTKQYIIGHIAQQKPTQAQQLNK